LNEYSVSFAQLSRPIYFTIDFGHICWYMFAMQIRMNVHSIMIALTVTACAADAPTNSPLAARLHEAPVSLSIDAGSLALSVTNGKGVAIPNAAPAITGGTIVLDAIDDRLRVLDLDIALSDVDLPAEAVGLADGLSFVDMHLGTPQPFDALTTWSDAEAIAVPSVRLELRWALGTDRGPSPLANQRVTTDLRIAVAGDAAGALAASLRITASGSLWHFGQLSLSDLVIDLGASQR
jgi:hypothetical protein